MAADTASELAARNYAGYILLQWRPCVEFYSVCTIPSKLALYNA